MKLSITALVSAFLLFGLVTTGVAQTNPSTGTTPPSATAPGNEAAKPSTEPARPSADIKGEVKSDNRDTTIDVRSGRSGQRDEGSALPRSAVEQRSVFGMSPTVAIIAGAAILLIVILAIVALGRGGSTDVYLDRDRRV